MIMPQWLIDYIANQTADGWNELHWSTKRRMAITYRCPASRQQEALLDNANGRPEKLAEMNADIDAIKLAIPKV